ncbi:MFS transporter [Xenorhabdus bovienii]|uniref:MFS transporter n=1 Tax=Xenorhabdus bovienii TaxID=40576 RepID=UPI0023B331B8|nr:MFS transporter [Xenorhabdus bovienii]MDE9555324.1 MFS transporter [Xenorhabdus bovienii]
MNTATLDRQGLTLKTWLALIFLALSTFTIVTTELAPIGLLTPMAKGLHQSESMIGLTVTLYAWVGAISALLSSLFLGNLPKKQMLMILTLIILVSNSLCATVDNYSWLLFARVIGALAHGAFWAMIGATAVSLVPIRFIGLATSVVFGGVSAASVFGVPLSNYIGLNIGWRTAFWLMSLLSIVAFVGIAWIVPAVKNQSALGLAALQQVMRSSALWKIYAATLLVITAHFAAFTFIEPWLHGVASVSSTMIPIVLFVFGLAGLAGNFLTGVLIDKWLKPMVTLSVILIASTLIVLGQLSNSLTSSEILLLVIVWGLAVSGIFVGFQTWVLRLAGDNAFPATAVYVSFFNGAIGSGALVGAWMVSLFSIPILLGIAGIAIALTLLLVAVIPIQVVKETILTGEIE